MDLNRHRKAPGQTRHSWLHRTGRRRAFSSAGQQSRTPHQGFLEHPEPAWQTIGCGGLVAFASGRANLGRNGVEPLPASLVATSGGADATRGGVAARGSRSACRTTGAPDRNLQRHAEIVCAGLGAGKSERRLKRARSGRADCRNHDHSCRGYRSDGSHRMGPGCRILRRHRSLLAPLHALPCGQSARAKGERSGIRSRIVPRHRGECLPLSRRYVGPAAGAGRRRLRRDSSAIMASIPTHCCPTTSPPKPPAPPWSIGTSGSTACARRA